MLRCSTPQQNARALWDSNDGGKRGVLRRRRGKKTWCDAFTVFAEARTSELQPNKQTAPSYSLCDEWNQTIPQRRWLDIFHPCKKKKVKYTCKLNRMEIVIIVCFESHECLKNIRWQLKAAGGIFLNADTMHLICTILSAFWNYILRAWCLHEVNQKLWPLNKASIVWMYKPLCSCCLW